MKNTFKVLAIALVSMALTVACNNKGQEEPIDSTPIEDTVVVEDTVVEEVAEEVVAETPAQTTTKATPKKDDSHVVKGEATPTKKEAKVGEVKMVTTKETKTVADEGKTPAPVQKGGIKKGAVTKVE